jgi:serine/threonine-protein kinase
MMSRMLENDKVGSFRILEKIGEGGMAIIFKATQPALKRDVVIKKLKDPNREIIERFKKEAFVSASLSQENVLAIYDFIYAGKSYYLVMEYVDGQDLRTIIDFGAPVPPNISALIIREVAKGLEYTHTKNIIHRDIKPSNIIISFQGDVKLIDFGVAKDETPSRLTITGMIVGTPSYMSPEQANGDRIGKESDIYSIGVLLYEVVTGIKPFLGDTNTEILMRIAKGKFPSPKRYNREIPWRLTRIIKKSMKKDRSKRYKNASELIRDLNKFIPWQEHTNKKEILARYLTKFEDKKRRRSTTKFQPAFMQGSSPRFWFMAAALIILFIFAAYQTNRFFQRERLVDLEISTNIANCIVYLDDRVLGKIENKQNVFSNISPGIYTLKIIGPERNSVYQGNLTLTPGVKAAVNAYIPYNTTSVAITAKSSPSGAKLYIDEQFVGLTPITQLSLRGGQHQFKLEKDGYNSYNEKFECKINHSYNLHFTLEPLLLPSVSPVK